jgi:hypothetical protein
VVTIEDTVNWTGKRHFMIEGMTRPDDANACELREFDNTIFIYVPGTLPAGATNDYGPDYSFTKPVAPTLVTVVSQGTATDTDGKVTAYALIRATPPAANWVRLIALITDTITQEEYQAQLTLNGANYEATISGLRPNRNCNVIVWAVNGNGVEGVESAPVAFTTANYTTAPNAPASCTATQLSPRQNRVAWANVTPAAGAPPIDGFDVFKKVGAGSFTLVNTVKSLEWIDDNVSFATAYQYKVQARDRNGNPSVDSPTASITTSRVIDDSYVVTSGINGGSIGNGSINRGRGLTGTGSQSGSLGAGGAVSVGGDFYMFFPGVGVDASIFPTYMMANIGGPAVNDQGLFYLYNQSANSGNYGAFWRTFLP